MRILKLITDWYQGQYEPPENLANSDVYFPFGTYKRHWTARAANILVDFYLTHWKFVVTIALSIIGLLFASPWFK